MQGVNISSRLNRLKYIELKIKSKRQEILDLKDASPKGQVYTDEPKGSKKGNSTEDLNIKIIDAVEKLREEIKQLLEERDIIIKAIEELEDPFENIVLRLLYVNNYTWLEARRVLNCSHATVQRARDKAIEHLKINDTDVNK